MSVRDETADVVIVGGGPSGLAAAEALACAGAGRVVVLERESATGGIPRHADHQGYGLRDLRRSLTGPRYAERWTQRAADAGADLRVATQVTGWTGDGALELTSPSGRGRLRAGAVVLATGCRERPRPARWVAGTRPQGVMTTGMLQQLVHLAHARPGREAVVVGAEHVSFSALQTLADAGARAVAMTTELAHHQSYAAFRLGAAARFRVPLRTRTAVTAVRGRPRVTGVELTDLDTGAVAEVACDLVVFTGDWIGDHELAVLGGLELDRATSGPRVDGALRTSRAGVFAAGNLLHGAETADVAALSGRHVAAAVLDHLRGAAWPAAPVALRCAAPLHWVAPSAVTPGVPPPRGRYLLRAHEELLDVRLEITQDGRDLARPRLRRVTAGRSASLDPGWSARVDPRGGAVDLRVLSARRRP